MLAIVPKAPGPLPVDLANNVLSEVARSGYLIFATAPYRDGGFRETR